MSSEPCSMALLVEAKRDGRLGARDVASVGRHLASCAGCAELAASLDDVKGALREPTAPPTPLEVQRGRLRLLREAALPQPPARGERRRSMVVAALVVATAALLVLVADRRPPASGGPPKDPSASAVSTPSRTAIRVVADPLARVSRAEANGAEIVTLHDGGVSLSVRDLRAGERFLVRTGDAEVEARGTEFRVEAAADQIQNVSVAEGNVEVRFAGTVFLVNGGERWGRPFQPEAPAPPSGPVFTRLEAPSTERRLAALGRPIAPRPARIAGSFPRADDASRTLIDGVGLIKRGDYGAAAERLDAFARSHPTDDRAEDSTFLAIIALQRAGRGAEAASASRRYLARYPAGYHRGEAKRLSEEP